MAVKVFGHTIKFDEKMIFPVKVGEYADGSPISLLVRVIVGSHEGSTVSMLGCQHGDEYCGMEIINKLFDSISSKNLHGILIGLPVSNPLAFNAADRASPPSMGYENLNMNRVWPGDSHGLLLERIAAYIWDEIIQRSNTVIDLHEGGKAFMARYIHARGTPETERLIGTKLKKLYQWFGQSIPVLGGVNTRPSMMGTLSVQAGLNGIPVLSPELGGGGRLWEEHVLAGVKGVRNVLIGLELIKGEMENYGLSQLVSDGSSWPKTKHGGILSNTCDLNAIVEKGGRIAVLKDTAGRVIEELYAPYRSVIFDTRWQPTIYPGDWTLHCGKLE